jgi:DNA (cytosine-5)-methyltransferase 1
MPKAISLFSGAGGLDIGLAYAGITTVASVELDKHCADTLRRNTPSDVFQGDVRGFDPRSVLNGLGLTEIDVLHGGPPCQPFSQIGAQKGLGHKDGMLLYEMIRWIDELRPKAFIIEQVKGLLRHAEAFAHLKSSLMDMGYQIDWKLLNSVEHGVAQMRQRVFIVGSRQGGVCLEQWIKPNSDIKTVGSVISDLPSPETEAVANHFDKTPARDRERISYVKEGEWLSKAEAPADIIKRLTKKDTTKFRRLDRNLPSLTLRCGEIFYHPLQNRYLTPREYMRIHGYPDTHILCGPIRGRTGQVTNLDQHRQIANSVPPPLAKAVGKAVLENILCQ